MGFSFPSYLLFIIVCKEVADFCMLILYIPTLINSLILWDSFVIDSLEVCRYIKKSSVSSSSRWQHRRPLNSPFCWHTKSTAIYGAISSERNLETGWVTPTYWVNKKIFTLGWIWKAKTNLCHKPYTWHRDKQSGGNSQLPASPWGLKGLDPTSSIPMLKTSTWGAGPQTSSSETQQGLLPWDPQDYSKERNSY